MRQFLLDALAIFVAVVLAEIVVVHLQARGYVPVPAPTQQGSGR